CYTGRPRKPKQRSHCYQNQHNSGGKTPPQGRSDEACSRPGPRPCLLTGRYSQAHALIKIGRVGDDCYFLFARASRQKHLTLKTIKPFVLRTLSCSSKHLHPTSFSEKESKTHRQLNVPMQHSLQRFARAVCPHLDLRRGPPG